LKNATNLGESLRKSTVKKRASLSILDVSVIRWRGTLRLVFNIQILPALLFSSPPLKDF
jgi:hypothetical protein